MVSIRAFRLLLLGLLVVLGSARAEEASPEHDDLLEQLTAEQREARRELRRLRMERTELLVSQTVGAGTSVQTLVPSTSYALSIDADVDLGGNIFKDGFPFLHTDSILQARNVALGRLAMVSLTPYQPYFYSGTNNTALGSYALRYTSSGRNNTGTGAYALVFNTEGVNNSASGALALFSNTTGYDNTAVGASALLANTSGSSNTALGVYALSSVTNATGNTAVGAEALASTTSGYFNTAVGTDSLSSNTGGDENAALGRWALFSNTIGDGNVAIGANTLTLNTVGSYNTAVGTSTLRGNTTGSWNIAVGLTALYSSRTGSSNIAVGSGALFNNDSGSQNTAVGQGAMGGNVVGTNNIAIGARAGDLTSGDNNILIGDPGVAGESSAMRIGLPGVTSSTYVEGIFGASTDATGVMVFVDGDNQLGTMVSSRRFKEEIQSMGRTSVGLEDLRPVTFRYRSEAASGEPRPLEFGLIAEEVAEVFPDLVVYDEQGEPYTVRYHLLTPMLLNELQRLQREVDVLRAQLGAARLEAREHVDLLAGIQGRLTRLELAPEGTRSASAARPSRAP